MVRVYNLPTVAAAGAGGSGNGGSSAAGAAPAAAAAPAAPVSQSQLAERELMLQAAQRAKSKAEEDARQAQRLAQEREAEAKRYKLHVEALLAEMAKKDKRYQEQLAEQERSARQAVAAAAAPPVLPLQPAQQQYHHPGQQLYGHHQHQQHPRAWPLQPPHGPHAPQQQQQQPHGQGPPHQGAPGLPQGPNGTNGTNGSGHGTSSSASSSSASTNVSGVLRPPSAVGPVAGAGSHDAASGPLPAAWASGPKPPAAAVAPSGRPGSPDAPGASVDGGGGSGRFASSPYPWSHASLHGSGATQQPQSHTPHQAAGYPGTATGRPALFERVFGVAMEGCRFVAVDAERGRLLATESSGIGGGNTFIRKISLASPESSTRIRLPANAGLVTDLQLPPPDCGSAPAAQRLVAVVARGAGLCLACPQADSVVASFKGLPTRAVSCSWVGSSSGGSSSSNGSSSSGGHLLLAGLEQGNLALLDVRRPDRPVAVLPVLANTQRCAQMPQQEME
eukprot:XP_001692475.1 predicted protein [Chlamydomonas reinhardtii]